MGLTAENVGDNIRQGLRMAMVLPLLPEELIAAGRRAVREMLLVNHVPAHLDEAIGSFARYLERQWANERISVHRADNRTNNAVESFHGRMLRSMGRHHPSVWIFINVIQNIEHSLAMDFLRLRRGEGIPVRTRRGQMQLDQQIGKQL